MANNGEKWRIMAMANSSFSFVKFAIFRQHLILEFHIGGGANPIFPIFPIPISEKSTFISGKSGNSFSPISPSLITLGHMLIHNFYINVLIALILVYRNSM